MKPELPNNRCQVACLLPPSWVPFQRVEYLNPPTLEFCVVSRINNRVIIRAITDFRSKGTLKQTMESRFLNFSTSRAGIHHRKDAVLQSMTNRKAIMEYFPWEYLEFWGHSRS
ncbi:hypothetical protein PIB30_044505 [Stylosanthes scabra]|uniref:Uncharacterized protein n=1 Tax=Stylosanthes scabra TaxID=79078 RepID=A0ABU6ZEM1_9FABA|nr:hypothetical protein [Stylosanthes scabra]